MLKSVDDACDFIAEWCREDGNYAGAPLRTKFPVPDAIVRLNARLGGLWHGIDRLPKHAAPFFGVLGGQDRILDPSEYARDRNGVVPFISENQGVWVHGFDPDDIDRLLVRGDWYDGCEVSFKTEWRPFDAGPEDALVHTLLINLCLQSDAHWDDDAPRPEAVHRVLWRHPAWTNFDGFWIDDARTLIWFSGWQIRRRPR